MHSTALKSWSSVLWNKLISLSVMKQQKQIICLSYLSLNSSDQSSKYLDDAPKGSLPHTMAGTYARGSPVQQCDLLAAFPDDRGSRKGNDI